MEYTVWEILSRQQVPFLLTSVSTGCWSPPRKCAPLRASGRKRPLHGTQHNFHETKRETLKRAKPQVVTSRDNRLTDTSKDRWRRDRKTEHTQKDGTDKPHLAPQGEQTVFILEKSVRKNRITLLQLAQQVNRKFLIPDYPNILTILKKRPQHVPPC